MTTRRTLKGFTIPPGYTLNITKDDGDVITKQPGENSGSHYSFQEVLEGIDPDWELIQEQGYMGEQMQTSSVPASSGWENLSVEELDSVLRPKEVVMRDASKIRTRDYYNEGLSEEVIDILDGLSDRDLVKLSKLPYSESGRIKDLTVDFILSHGFEYTSSEEAAVDFEMVEEAIMVQTRAKEPSVGKAISASLLEYYAISDRAKRDYFPRGVTSVINHAVELMSHTEGVDVDGVYDLSDEMEPWVPKEDLPEIEGPEDLFFALEEFKNPDNVIRILAGIDTDNLGEEPSFRDSVFNIDKNPQQQVDEAWAKYNNEYSKAFRDHILFSTEHLDWNEDFTNRFVRPKSDYINVGFTEQQLEGAMFAFSFVHPSFYDNIKNKIAIMKLKGDARAWADSEGLGIFMSANNTPGVFAHEAAHVIEAHNNEEMLGLNTIPYLMSRVGADDKGVLVGYDDDGIETGFRDNFRHPYTGKLYYRQETALGTVSTSPGKSTDEMGMYFGDLVRGSRFYATEVLSMGLQMMYDNPIAFARDDPSFFKHIWRMRTNPRLYSKKE